MGSGPHHIASEPEFDPEEFEDGGTAITQRRRLTPEQRKRIQIADTVEVLLGKKPPEAAEAADAADAAAEPAESDGPTS